MSIWDDLYKDLIKVELRQDGLGAEASDAAFKTVEAKVEELRSRVCLDTVSSLTKEAALRKTAADSAKDKNLEQCAIDAKSYAASLVDMRRSSIGLRAIMDEIKNKFYDKIDMIRDLEKEIEEFQTQKQQKLNELELNTSYPAIKRLYKEISEYMKDGESRKVNIPFPEVKRRIKGFLSGDTRKETWVKLETDD